MPIERYQISIKVLLKNNEGKFLFLENPSNSGKHSDRYDLPGGRIDVGELDRSIVEILGREINEELGADVRFEIDHRPIALARATVIEGTERIPVLYMIFVGKFVGGNIVISSEHKSYVWDVMEGVDLDEFSKTGRMDGMEKFLIQRR